MTYLVWERIIFTVCHSAAATAFILSQIIEFSGGVDRQEEYMTFPPAFEFC